MVLSNNFEFNHNFKIKDFEVFVYNRKEKKKRRKIV